MPKTKVEIQIAATGGDAAAEELNKAGRGAEALANVAGLAGLSLAGASTAALVFVKESIAAANEARDAQVLLNNALANTGQLTEEASEAIGRLAGKYEDLTNISDETWSDAAAKLIQYGAKVEDMEKLFPILEGLAGRMGGDVAGASSLLGMSIAGNSRGLKQLGVEISDTATRTEIMEAVTLAATKGQGLLGEKARTLAGQLDGLAKDWGNLQEGIGQNITKGGEMTGVLHGLSSAVKFVTTHIDFLIKAAVRLPGIAQALALFGSFFKGPAVDAASLAKQSEEAAKGLTNAGDAGTDSKKGLDAAKEAAKQLAAELKKADDQAKAAAAALKKIEELKREIVEATEKPSGKTLRLGNEEEAAKDAVAESYQRLLRQPLDRRRAPEDIAADFTNPISGVSDPEAKAGALQRVADLVKAQVAARENQEAVSTAAGSSARGNETGEMPSGGSQLGGLVSQADRVLGNSASGGEEKLAALLSQALRQLESRQKATDRMIEQLQAQVRNGRA